MTAGARPSATFSSDEPLLSVDGVFKHYTTRSRRVVRAVDGVTFFVRRGEILSLMGESGGGKITTAQIILALESPGAGEVRYAGVPVAAHGRALRRRMQVVFQNPYSSLDPRMRIREVLREPLRIHGIPRAQQDVRIDALLAMVHLGLRPAERYPAELSGGQRQRVAIARARILQPEFIVLAEPVSALDVAVQARIVNLLKTLQADQGLTFLFISHDLRVVRHMSDRIAVRPELLV